MCTTVLDEMNKFGIVIVLWGYRTLFIWKGGGGGGGPGQVWRHWVAAGRCRLNAEGAHLPGGGTIIFLETYPESLTTSLN
jgi:hypothetical protein